MTLQRLEDGLASGMPYHWRVRLLYDPVTTPFATRGRWITFPWGGWNEAMLRTPIAPLGRASELVLIKTGPGITANVDRHRLLPGDRPGSCAVRGNARKLHEPRPRDLQHGGGSTWSFTPLPGNRYFLLVPVNPSREGSYGAGVAGAERPPSASACAPQLVAACP